MNMTSNFMVKPPFFHYASTYTTKQVEMNPRYGVIASFKLQSAGSERIT